MRGRDQCVLQPESPCRLRLRRLDRQPGKLHDWSPLKGHTILVVADADEPGRRFATKVATCLVGQGFDVFVAMPPGRQGIRCRRRVYGSTGRLARNPRLGESSHPAV